MLSKEARTVTYDIKLRPEVYSQLRIRHRPINVHKITNLEGSTPPSGKKPVGIFRKAAKKVISSRDLKRLTLNYDKFFYPFWPNISELLRLFEKSIHRLGNLQDLTLILDFPPVQMCQSLYEVAKYIGRLSSLTSICFRFKDRDLQIVGSRLDFMNEMPARIAKSIKKLNFLKVVVLEFRNFRHMTNEGLKPLIQGFSRLTHLQSLSLSVTGCHQVGDETMEILATSIKKLKCLRFLFIHAGESKHITDLGIKAFSQGLEAQTNLLAINLSLDGNKKMTDEALKFVGMALQKLTLLENASIDFGMNKNNITDAGLNKISDSLRILTSLKKVYLNFAICDKITDKALQYLGENLPHSLEHVTFDFSLSYGLTIKGPVSLVTSLKEIISLKYVKLDFASPRITHEEGYEFREMCKKTFPDNVTVLCKVENN